MTPNTPNKTRSSKSIEEFTSIKDSLIVTPADDHKLQIYPTQPFSNAFMNIAEIYVEESKGVLPKNDPKILSEIR